MRFFSTLWTISFTLFCPTGLTKHGLSETEVAPSCVYSDWYVLARLVLLGPTNLLNYRHKKSHSRTPEA